MPECRATMVNDMNPRWLNAEEIALLDQCALRLFVDQPGNGGTADDAYKTAMQLIEARIKFFKDRSKRSCECVGSVQEDLNMNDSEVIRNLFDFLNHLQEMHGNAPFKEVADALEAWNNLNPPIV